MATENTRIAVLASHAAKAQRCKKIIEQQLTSVPEADADYIVALGGDGFMLEVLRRNAARKQKIYGINCGSIGFLMNAFDDEDIREKLKNAVPFSLFPLVMETTCHDGTQVCHLAFNDISLFRRTAQVAKLRISVNGCVRMAELLCDGINLSTPAGSTAYNLSVHGPILPLSSNVIALMPIAPFRPRRWRGALIPHDAWLEVEALEIKKRPISAVADNAEVKDVVRVRMHEDRKHAATILFDSEQSLQERVIKEQFSSEI